MKPAGKIDVAPKEVGKRSVTIGSSFRPGNLRGNLTKELETLNVNQITLYPKARNRITRVD